MAVVADFLTSGTPAAVSRRAWVEPRMASTTTLPPAGGDMVLS
jgi:hypothetical protein